MQLELNQNIGVPRRGKQMGRRRRNWGGVAITVSVAGGKPLLFKVQMLAFFSITPFLNVRPFPSKGCLKWKQYFGCKVRKCFILF